MSTDNSALKADLDRLAQNLRESEEKIYTRMNDTDKNIANLNTNIQLALEKITSFVKLFESHDGNEMEKYGKIEEAFRVVREELEAKDDKYASKAELKEVKEDIHTMSQNIQKGFKIFWIGSGVVLTIGAIGGVVMWIVSLMAQINRLQGGG